MPTSAALQDSNAIDAPRTIETFLASLRSGERRDSPYVHWLLQHCLPDEMIDAVTRLPIAPSAIEDTQGRRETHNDSRIHFGPAYRSRHPVMDVLAQVFQSPMVTASLQTITGAQLIGTSLRIEYCQDSDGFWLEPHTDIGVKKFTMLIYLNREPEGTDWGTDIYADHDTHAGRAPAGRNRGLIFVPSDKTWARFREAPPGRRTQVAHHQLRRSGVAQPPRAVLSRPGHRLRSEQSSRALVYCIHKV